MSADLLAEFGTGTRPGNTSVNLQGTSQVESTESFFDDDFDSFVSPEPAHSSTLGLDEDIIKHEISESGSQYAFGVIALPPVSRDSEVLFDATTDATSNEDVDWGTFETAESVPSGQLLDIAEDDHQPVMPARTSEQSISNNSGGLDLLSMEDKLRSKRNIPPKIAPSQRHKQTITKKETNPKPTLQIRSQEKPSKDDFFEEWDSFEDDFTAKASSPSPNLLSQSTAISATKGMAEKLNTRLNNSRNSSQSKPDVRPTNIPPPSILLQIFPSLLEGFREQLNASKRKSLTSASGLHLSLTLKVASRVVAGRALRWKRDSRLSQSMKIGPAQSGKSSGMKLSSVSKGESIKEEQETVGLIDIWRHHASAFNSILQTSGERPVPIITDKVRITTAGPEQGALKAPHACALCGLKRDERLPKIDDDVHDSFGDWWAEHWGHKDCKWFWEENSNKLHQR